MTGDERVTGPDLADLVASLAPAQLVELVRLAVERALELGAVDIVDGLAQTARAARGDIIGRSWEPTERPQEAPP